MPDGGLSKRGTPVWVLQAGMTYGARHVAPGNRPGVVWLNVCVLGTHLPQMYRAGEVHPVTGLAAPGLGLCTACLGFGTAAELPDMFYPYGVDELPAACPQCEGSGRPAVLVTVVRAGGGIEGSATLRPHAWVKPIKGALPGRCAACGGVHGDSIHVDDMARPAAT
jgi:hypothetical protein